MSDINSILKSKANSAQMIDFSISESNTLDHIRNLTDIEVIANFQYLVLNSVRFNYIDALKYIISKEPSYKHRRYSNIEIEIDSREMLLYCDSLGVIKYSFLNYIILEKFIRRNDLESLNFIINKIGLYNLDKKIINNLNRRGMKKDTKEYLINLNLI